MSATIGNAGNNTASIYNALVPPEGPRTVSDALLFDGITTSYLFDFTSAFLQGKLSAVQTLWFDASAQSAATLVTVENSGQTLILPAGGVGSLPLIAPTKPRIRFDNASGGIVRVQFLNVPLPGVVYQAAAASAQPQLSGVSPAVHAVAVGGTAVVPFAAGAIGGAGSFILNPIDATEPLYVDLLAPAGTASPGANGTTIRLDSGQSLALPAGLASAVSVNAATTGHAFVAVGFAA